MTDLSSMSMSGYSFLRGVFLGVLVLPGSKPGEKRVFKKTQT